MSFGTHSVVERFRRDSDETWTLTESRWLEATLILNSASITIPLSEIYDRVDFSTSETVSTGRAA